MNGVDEPRAFGTHGWVVNLCTCTRCKNLQINVGNDIGFEVLGTIGFVAWVMAVLLNYLELLLKKCVKAMIRGKIEKEEGKA